MLPEASIIIPNFNNGCQSSLDGRTDLLGDLLNSIEVTLGDQVSRVEIVIADDGSTDDSLQTARAWVQGGTSQGPGSRRLIELEHSGVLSAVLNRLMQATTGPVVFRFDGDIILSSEGWLDLALARFTTDDQLAVLGGTQLDPSGSVLGVGDLLFHPYGYQHLGAGLAADDRIESLVPDHVMGCFHIMRRSAFDSVGLYDETILRGQTVDLTVRLQQKGWGMYTDTALRYVHRLGLRTGRAARSDQPEGIRHSLDTFQEKWGFDRLCPDQHRMRARLGDQLVPESRIDQSLLSTGLDAAPAAVENRVQLVRNLLIPDQPMRIASIGTGDGRLETILASQGVLVTAIEDRSQAVAAARALQSQAAHHRIPHLVEDLSRLALPDGGLDLLLVDQVLERYPNPIALLRELHRLLSPQGVMVLLARWCSPKQQLDRPRALGRFTPTGLRSLLQNSSLFRSVEFRNRPLVQPEPELLLYALRPCGEQKPMVGEPALCQ